MDTITVPELLKHFQEAGDGIEAICVDVSRMSYVSSAGLRVLLMMYKSLANKGRFEMTDVSEDVRKILSALSPARRVLVIWMCIEASYLQKMHFTCHFVVFRCPTVLSFA